MAEIIDFPVTDVPKPRKSRKLLAFTVKTLLLGVIYLFVGWALSYLIHLSFNYDISAFLVALWLIYIRLVIILVFFGLIRKEVT